MTAEIFPFRYRDPLTGKWVNARYKATPEEIAERHPEGWEITGPGWAPVDTRGEGFNPLRPNRR